MVANTVPTSAIAEMVAEQQEATKAQTAPSPPVSEGKARGEASQGQPVSATPEVGNTSVDDAKPQDNNAPPATEGKEEPAQPMQEELATPTKDESMQEEPAAAVQNQDREVAFSQSQTVDGVTVSVKADKGVFPKDATLSVSKVATEEQKKVDEAVDAKRNNQESVAGTFTFDIKILDASKNELQPADDKKVEVSFSLPQVADANLTTSVYHVEEKGDGLEAQKLDAKENESQKKVTAESDGFSYYTVEFTYGSLQYVLAGNGSVKLADILKSVGLKGEPQAATTSNPELFSVTKGSGEWVVTAHQAFDTKEWLKVTIAGVEYQIDVTDDQATRYTGQTSIDGGTYSVQGNVKVDGCIFVRSSTTLFLEEGSKLECEGIDVWPGATLTIDGQKDIGYLDQADELGERGLDGLTAGKLYVSTSDESSPQAAINVPMSASLVVEGGIVNAQTVAFDVAAIGSSNGDDPGPITINGGFVQATAATNGAGIGGGLQGSSGKITINGGEVLAQGGANAAGIGGGFEGACDTITINGGTINAIGGDEGAGIGSGNDTHHQSPTGTIRITGGSVGAMGGVLAAGIGSGADAESGLASIEISGAQTNVYAFGNLGAAGIGGGSSSGCAHISINGATVHAEGQMRGSGIGGGAGRAATAIDISNAKVYAKGDYGAGIGSGAGAIGNKNAGRIAGGRITITNSTVLAHSLSGGAGIGGGIHGDGGVISISGGKVAALGGASRVDSKAQMSSYGKKQFNDYTNSNNSSSVVKDVIADLGMDLDSGRMINFGLFGDLWDTITWPARKTWGAIAGVYQWTWKELADLYSWPFELANKAAEEIMGNNSKTYEEIYYTGAGIGGGYRCAGGQITITNDARVDVQAGMTDHDVRDNAASASIGRGKAGPDPTGAQPTNTSVYATAKVTHGQLDPLNEAFEIDLGPNRFYREMSRAEVSSGRAPQLSYTLNLEQYAVIEPGEFPITFAYVPVSFVDDDVILDDTMMAIGNATYFHFGILSSAAHVAWLCCAAKPTGDMFRYTPNRVYSTFVWPEVTEEQRAKIENAARLSLGVPVSAQSQHVLYPRRLEPLQLAQRTLFRQI